MRSRRSALLRALGASMLAALALTAIAASSAQASGNGLWLINLATPSYPVNVDGLLGVDSLEALRVGSLLGHGLTVDCNKTTFTGTLTSTTHGKGTAELKGCCFLVGGNPSEVCLIPNHVVKCESLVAELLFLGTVVRFRPLTGLILAK